MPDTSDTALRQFDAFNHWLGDVYGEGTTFDTLLLREGFSEAEIEPLERAHLSEFLQAVIDLLASYNDLLSEARKKLIVDFYGLVDGKPLSLTVIGDREGIARERIRQLINRRLDLYHNPERQAVFQRDVAAIARRLLDN